MKCNRIKAISLYLLISYGFWASSAFASQTALDKLATLEATSGGRLGVFAIDTANNKTIGYRPQEQFPMCSTAKLMVVAAVLKQSMTDKNLLQQKITYTNSDLADWSPITGKHVKDGMTVADLCAAAITQSDNTAVNLLIKKLGGFNAVNAFARSIDDKDFRIDRYEPEATLSIPGDLRDTTTPAAMERSLQKLVLGNVLAKPQRNQLEAWLKANTTGTAEIRAGVPKGWSVGDKTGTGSGYGTTNDIGIIWPPKCSPIAVAIYFTQNKQDATKREDVIASATRILIDEFANTDTCLYKKP